MQAPDFSLQIKAQFWYCNQQSSYCICQLLLRTWLCVSWSSVVAYKKWVAAAEDCSALSCLPGTSESRQRVQGWPQWSEVICCYCGPKGYIVRVQMSKPVLGAWLIPGVDTDAEGMLLGLLTPFSSLRSQWEQGKPVMMLLHAMAFLCVI